MEFAERIKKVQKEAEVILKKAQDEIKKQANGGRKKVEKQKKNNKMILSRKDLVFKE